MVHYKSFIDIVKKHDFKKPTFAVEDTCPIMLVKIAIKNQILLLSKHLSELEPWFTKTLCWTHICLCSRKLTLLCSLSQHFVNKTLCSFYEHPFDSSHL